MPDRGQQERRVERRRKPRGGRRAEDLSGTTPLVLVVGGNSAARDASEAVLAKLRFAVAISDTPKAALEGMTSLRPDIVVVAPHDVLEMRTTAPADLPIVVLREDPELTVEAIRRSLAFQL